jgi:hypothetical protein
VTKVKESGLPKTIVYADDIVKWKPNESTLEKKFQTALTACKDFGLNVNFGTCVVMKISWKTRGMEKIKFNNHYIKEVEIFGK